jgi:cytochrome c-type protein NapC
MRNLLRWPLRHWKLTLAFFVGAFAALFFLGFTHMSFELTGTNEFCGRCHEMLPQVRTWQMSGHADNPAGVVANCVDCHLPPTGVSHYAYKAWSGLRDVVVHYLGDPAKVDWDGKRFTKEDYLFEDACQKCHQDLTPAGMSRGGFLAHRAWERGRIEKKCWDCHENLVHHEVPVLHTVEADLR